jgi:hypothetical protein
MSVRSIIYDLVSWIPTTPIERFSSDDDLLPSGVKVRSRLHIFLSRIDEKIVEILRMILISIN